MVRLVVLSFGEIPFVNKRVRSLCAVSFVQFPFVFDGGAACDLHLHLSQDAVPCHSRAKKKSVNPEEEDAEEKDYENSDEEDGNHGVERYGSSSSSVFDFSASHSAINSGLPSANDVFS